MLHSKDFSSLASPTPSVGKVGLDHDDFGLDQSKIIVIESQSLKRDAGGGWKRPLSAERRASQAEGTECLWQTRS